MRATYQEITDKMRAAFFDACGEKPEDLPELDARFRSVATELYALSVFGDHVQSQVFADTARGADLDRHAADVGLQRKGASAAAGAAQLHLAGCQVGVAHTSAGNHCAVLSAGEQQHLGTGRHIGRIAVRGIHRGLPQMGRGHRLHLTAAQGHPGALISGAAGLAGTLIQPHSTSPPISVGSTAPAGSVPAERCR